jgi:hypothetical protein
MAPSKKPRKKAAPKEPIDVNKELTDALAEKPRTKNDKAKSVSAPIPEVGDKVTLKSSSVGSIFEVTKVRLDGKRVDLTIPRTNFERIGIPFDDLNFVEQVPRSKPSRPTAPSFNSEEIKERLALVQQSAAQQLSDDLVILKKYLESQRVPHDVIDELHNASKDIAERWQNAVDRIEKLLQE